MILALPTVLTAETRLPTHTRLRALNPACDASLASLTLPASEAGDFVELILLQHAELPDYHELTVRPPHVFISPQVFIT